MSSPNREVSKEVKPWCYCNLLVDSKCDFCAGIRSWQAEAMNHAYENKEKPADRTVSDVMREETARLKASHDALVEACKLMLIEHERYNIQMEQTSDTPGMALAKKALKSAGEL